MSITGSEQWMYNSGGFYDYPIEQSIRIPSGTALKNDTVANTTRTYDSAKIFTYSFWTKLQGNAVNIISLNDTPANGEFAIQYGTDNKFIVYSNGQFNGRTSATFTDFSAWYHVCLVMDTTQATAANRARLYINGTLYSLTAQPSQNLNIKAFTTATRGAIGARYQDNGTINYQASGGSVLLAEFIYSDGVKHEPTVFGEDKDGVWIPKDASSIAIGTNGYHLDFSDQTINTSATSNTGFGKDIRNNQPNPQWIAVGGLAVHDGMDDTPTKNYCNLNPANNNNTLSQNNLVAVTATNTNSAGTLAVSSGKWYYEALIVTAGGSHPFVGFALSSASFVGSTSSFVNGTSEWVGNGGLSNGDVVGLGIDLDNNIFYTRINGATTTFRSSLNVTAGEYVPAISGVNSQIRVNFGQEGTFAGQITAGGNTDANGYGDFKYPVPSGYLALNLTNRDYF